MGKNLNILLLIYNKSEIILIFFPTLNISKETNTCKQQGSEFLRLAMT